MNREQPARRTSANNRRKNTRAANRKKQTTSNTNPAVNDLVEEQEKEITSAEVNNEKDQESPDEQSDDEREQRDSADTEHASSAPEHIEDEQEPMTAVKARSKNATPAKEEFVVPPKPQASVAPVKQAPSFYNNHSSYYSKFAPHHHDNYYKPNGYSSAPYNVYNYSTHNTLPPRLQQQRQQREAEFAAQKFRKRRGPLPPPRNSLPPGSAGRSNEFVPSSYQEEEEEEEQYEAEPQPPYVNNEHNNGYVYPSEQQQQQVQESFGNHDYSSESEIVNDSPLNGGNNSISPYLSTSVGSQSSLQRLDLVRSLATSHGLLDELISIFDTVSFSSDELDMILNKIAAKHISTKQDLQRLLSSTKSDKTLERILDETYRSQAKILAIELQTEKNRVLELTKSNAEMENTIRQFQQQQPNNLVQYQQMIMPYQMQLQRLADENTRLQHQAHAYAMFPATINELKQQQHILTEKIRQMSIRNSALENEVADSERASKHAAEIYKKADAQKQERIEQMIADINKYKKLDKELTSLRQKHSELEASTNTKLNEAAQQCDELQKTCEQLKVRAQQYEQIKAKHDQLIKTPPNRSTAKLQEELSTLKAENDQLRQRNWKMVEELNRLLNEEQQCQDTPTS